MARDSAASTWAIASWTAWVWPPGSGAAAASACWRAACSSASSRARSSATRCSASARGGLDLLLGLRLYGGDALLGVRLRRLLGLGTNLLLDLGP